MEGTEVIVLLSHVNFKGAFLIMADVVWALGKDEVAAFWVFMYCAFKFLVHSRGRSTDSS